MFQIQKVKNGGYIVLDPKLRQDSWGATYTYATSDIDDALEFIKRKLEQEG